MRTTGELIPAAIDARLSLCQVRSPGFSTRSVRPPYGTTGAFTILEVVIACALFFMAVFAILSVISQGLVGARSLQQKQPDVGLLAALTVTNMQLIEGTESGDFEQLYPGVYPGYTWTRDIIEEGSNRLFRVTFYIHGGGGKGKQGAETVVSSILLWSPNSPPGSASKGGF